MSQTQTNERFFLVSLTEKEIAIIWNAMLNCQISGADAPYHTTAMSKLQQTFLKPLDLQRPQDRQDPSQSQKPSMPSEPVERLEVAEEEKEAAAATV